MRIAYGARRQVLYFGVGHRYSSGALARVVGTAREAAFLIRGPDQGPHFGNEKRAAMIDHHWDGIASYCRPENTVILGLVEGSNNKVRFLQCRGYRYRDEGYFTLKIVTVFRPPLTRSAGKPPL